MNPVEPFTKNDIPLNGRPIRAAVSMHFMVDPGGRSTLAAVKLLNTFFCGGAWTLTHSKNQEVPQAIYRGDLFLTRLEGEWCTRFQNE